MVTKNVKENEKILEVKNIYAAVIAEIYAEHHVNEFHDSIKHRDGIIKAMVDFAIFYKEHSSNELKL